MGNLRKINVEPSTDWYEVISENQPDSVNLGVLDRDRFNRAFESYAAESYVGAFKEFQELSEKGSSINQYFLGLMYLKGMGTLQDFLLAHMWLNMSSSQGHKKANACLEQLTKTISTEQVAEAQKLAREYLARNFN